MNVSTILYIEDDPNQIEIVRRLLEKEGHTVIPAFNGEGGIQAAEAYQPSLILMDINLPGMNGVQAMEAIRSQPGMETIPVIAVTTNTMHGDRDYYLKKSFNAYIPKPVMRAELIAAVRQFV